MNPKLFAYLLVSLLAAPVCGQIQIDTSGQDMSELITNAEIVPDSELTLLVLHGGNDDQAAIQLASMLAKPQTQALASWVKQLNVKFVQAGSVMAESKHRDLLTKHASLPIVALVEAPGTPGEGAVWWSAAPPSLPLDETQLAGTLTQYYTATIEAKAKATGQKEFNRYPGLTDERPAPYQPPRRPSIINPTVNVDHNVQVPNSITTSVEAGLRSDTQRGLLIAAAFIALGMVAIAGSIIASAVIRANAETQDPEEVRAQQMNQAPSQSINPFAPPAQF